MKGLEFGVNITHLYIQNNNIQRIGKSTLSALQNLQKLYLDNNCIPVLEGLENLHLLEELYISNQRLPEGQHFIIDPESIKAVRV